MQDWKLSKNIIILYYRRYSCGKFLSNVLSFNRAFYPQLPNRLIGQINTEDAKIQEIFKTLPSNKELCQHWNTFEFSDNGFWNFFDQSFRHENDLSGNFLKRIDPNIVNLLGTHYCFMTCHDPVIHQQLIKFFPNSTTIVLTNDSEINFLSVQLKTLDKIQPPEIPKIENCLEFDIGSLFNREVFLKTYSS